MATDKKVSRSHKFVLASGVALIVIGLWAAVRILLSPWENADPGADSAAGTLTKFLFSNLVAIKSVHLCLSAAATAGGIGTLLRKAFARKLVIIVWIWLAVVCLLFLYILLFEAGSAEAREWEGMVKAIRFGGSFTLTLLAAFFIFLANKFVKSQNIQNWYE